MDVLTKTLMPPLYDNHSATKRPRIAYPNGMADLPKPDNPAASAAAAATTAMTTSAPPSTVAAALLFDSTVPVATSTTGPLYGQNPLNELLITAANLFSKTTTSAGGVQLVGGSGGNINFANNSNALMPHNVTYTTDDDEDDSEDDVGAVTWKLSLSPSSMTLDTNIQDVAGLYEVIEQLSTNVADAKIKEIKPVTNDYDDSDTERTESSVRRNKSSGRMTASPAVTILFEVAGNMKPQEHPSVFDPSNGAFLRQELLSQCLDVFFTCYNRRLFHVDRASLTSNNLLLYSVCAVAGKHAAQSHLGMDLKKSDLIAYALFARARVSLEEALLSDGDDTSSSAETTLLSLLLLAHAPGYCVRNTHALGSTHVTMFITMALGIVYDLGLHKLDAPVAFGSASRSSNNPLRTPIQTERLRRLAWLAYITDYRASYAAQIPSIIRDEEPLPGWHVRWPEPIENEDDEQSSLGIAYLAQVARLTEWRKSNAMRRLYAPAQRGDRVPARVVWDLERQLKNWHHQLPKWLQYDASRKFPAATSAAMTEDAKKRSKVEQFKVQLGWMISMDYHSAWLQLHLLLIPKRFAGQTGKTAGAQGRKGEEAKGEDKEEEEEEEEEVTEPHNTTGHFAQEQVQAQRGRSQISTFSSRGSSSSQSSPRSSASPRASPSRSPSPESRPLSANSRLSALRSLRLCLESANAIVAIAEASHQHGLCEFDVDAVVAASSIYLLVLGAPKPLPAQANCAAFEAITRMAAIDITRLVRVTTKTVMANELSFLRLVGYLNGKLKESGIIPPPEKGAATQVAQILANYVKGLGVVA